LVNKMIKEEYQERLDELHERIKHLKDKRDSLNVDVQKEFETLKNIKKDLFKTEYEFLESSNKEIKKLEIQQMTNAMSHQEEKYIVGLISEISKKRNKTLNLVNENEQIKEQQEKVKSMKAEADGYHTLILELSDKATEIYKTIKECEKNE